MTTWLYHRGSSLAELRHEVRGWAAERRLSSPEDVALIVTELVTNAMVHGDAATVAVHLDPVGDGARVSVDDPSTRQPLPSAARPDDERGRGLLVVEALGSRWGWTQLPHGKRVWCEVR